MKNIKLFLMLLFFVPVIAAYSQVAINSSGINADPSAMLDISSSDKGLLVPRVSLNSIDNMAEPVSNPALGLLVYNINGSNLAPGFYVWNGVAWSAIATMEQVQSTVHGMEQSPVFGEMNEYHAPGTFTNISIPASGTYVNWNSSAAGDVAGMSFNASSLVASIDGTYNVSFNSVIQLPMGGKLVDAALFVNGVRQDDMHGRAWIKEGSKSTGLSFSGILNLEVNDVVTVGFTMDDDGTIRLEIANLNLARLN
jgi:hypothetical protein